MARRATVERGRAPSLPERRLSLDGAQASGSLRDFLEERWKGNYPILYGDQLRQARLDDWIFQGLLDVEHLPDADAAKAKAEEVVQA